MAWFVSFFLTLPLFFKNNDNHNYIKFKANTSYN